jgi:hypothetical protein
MPVAAATAEPPEEPAGLSAGFHGLRVGPNNALLVGAAGEFGRVGLGEHDRAGGFEAAHDFFVLARHIVFQKR